MPATYTLISSNVLGANATSVTFSSIPGTYTDLVLRFSARSNQTGTVDLTIVVNGINTGTLYSSTVIYAFGGNPASARYSNRNQWEMQNSFQSNSATANTFGNAELYIPSYNSGTSKVASLAQVAEDNGGFAGSGSGNANLGGAAHLLRSNSAITSLTLTGGTFLTNSSFYLYGIKNS